MAYDQGQRAAQKSHSLNMENREKLSLSGFDENLVILQTGIGSLTIRGEQLHISRIDLDSGSLELSGKIQELSYDEHSPAPSIWSRLFG